MTKDGRKTQESESSLLLLEKNLFWAQNDGLYFSVGADTSDGISRGQKIFLLYIVNIYLIN